MELPVRAVVAADQVSEVSDEQAERIGIVDFGEAFQHSSREHQGQQVDNVEKAWKWTAVAAEQEVQGGTAETNKSI